MTEYMAVQLHGVSRQLEPRAVTAVRQSLNVLSKPFWSWGFFGSIPIAQIKRNEATGVHPTSM